MYGLQEHEMRFYCLFKKVYFSLLATSDFFCRHAYAYAHMRIIRHESDMAAYAWPSLIPTTPPKKHPVRSELMLDIRSESGQAQLKAPMMQSKYRMEILPQRIYFFNDTKKELVAHKNRKNVLCFAI